VFNRNRHTGAGLQRTIELAAVSVSADTVTAVLLTNAYSYRYKDIFHITLKDHFLYVQSF
jgi:hypothetical protein